MEVQRRFIQTKIYYKFFLLYLEKNKSQIFKSIATAKNLFSSVYVVGTNCFAELFLFHVATGRQCFYKSLL